MQGEAYSVMFNIDESVSFACKENISIDAQQRHLLWKKQQENRAGPGCRSEQQGEELKHPFFLKKTFRRIPSGVRVAKIHVKEYHTICFISKKNTI